MLTNEELCMLSNHTIEELENILNFLENVPNNITMKWAGICFNLELACPGINGINFVKVLADGWPNHSGDEYFPIPVTDKKITQNPSKQYAAKENLWADEQGNLRIDLAKFIAAKVKEYLK